jgi:hypothetical protein
MFVNFLPLKLRRMMGIAIFICLGFLLGLTDCPMENVAIVLIPENSGTPVDIQVGQRFEFTFRWAPNAAYIYELTSLDQSIAKLIDVYADDTPDGCSDCPHYEHWIFLGINPGQTELVITKISFIGADPIVYRYPINVAGRGEEDR